MSETYRMLARERERELLATVEGARQAPRVSRNALRPRARHLLRRVLPHSLTTPWQTITSKKGELE